MLFLLRALVVMAAGGLAEKRCACRSTAEKAQGEAGDVQQVVAAMLNNHEAKIGNLLSRFCLGCRRATKALTA